MSAVACRFLDMKRALTTAEANALRYSIQHGRAITGPEPSDTTRGELLKRLRALRVTQLCGCGTCPSIRLARVGAEPVPRTAHAETILETELSDALLLTHIADSDPFELELAPTASARWETFPDLAASAV